MIRIGLAALLALTATAAQAQTPPCYGTEERFAFQAAGEVSAGNGWSQSFGPGWTLALAPAQHGWRLAVFDAAGLDLSQMTPPLHGPNPRELYGWHFRNAANDGPNEGDVNAPQHLRLFGFDPRLSGTAGWRPPAGGEGPDDQPGRGALFIRDLGLADLAPGEQARMVWLNFSACLTWPSEYGAAPPHEPETVEMIRACGLTEEYELGLYFNPASLEGDFDGDDAHDLAVPIARKADGKRGLAICRAGTWLDLVGLSGRLGVHLTPEYFDRVDWWGLYEKSEVFVGGEGAPPPTLVGDGIVIGKEDSSSVLIYWDGAGWTSYWQGD